MTMSIKYFFLRVKDFQTPEVLKLYLVFLDNSITHFFFLLWKVIRVIHEQLLFLSSNKNAF